MFLSHGIIHKENQIQPDEIPKIYAETLYNDNSNSYTSVGNSNSNNKVDNIRITHNSNKHSIGNSNRLNRIVRTAANPSINAKCV